MNYLVSLGRNVTAALLTGSKCEGFQKVLFYGSVECQVEARMILSSVIPLILQINESILVTRKYILK